MKTRLCLGLNSAMLFEGSRVVISGGGSLLDPYNPLKPSEAYASFRVSLFPVKPPTPGQNSDP